MTKNLDSLFNEARSYAANIVYTHNLPEGRRGVWHAPTRTIYLRYGMTQAQQAATLQHELIHAELGHEGTQSPETEQRVNELTALRLISPPEYAIAETAYGANAFTLARELDVTPTIIEAYQRVLGRSQRG